MYWNTHQPKKDLRITHKKESNREKNNLKTNHLVCICIVMPRATWFKWLISLALHHMLLLHCTRFPIKSRERKITCLRKKFTLDMIMPIVFFSKHLGHFFIWWVFNHWRHSCSRYSSSKAPLSVGVGVSHEGTLEEFDPTWKPLQRVENY